MDQDNFNQQLVTFLNASPTPFHATLSMKEALVAEGFTQLNESDVWQLTPGKYFVTRNQSSIIAFVLGSQPIVDTGIRMVGAHTDSPCLKVKPAPERSSVGYRQLTVEKYGGMLLNPWFDRDLSLAGRVTYRTKAGELRSELVNLSTPIAVIPSLAIHLDREANENRKVNPETDMPAVLLIGKEDFTLNNMLSEILGGHEILASDLFFYDTNPAAIIGLKQDFLASARLDNLLSCFTGLSAIISADPSVSSLLVCNDHEEVGSASAAGAQGTFLADVLGRITPDHESNVRMISRSLMISTDNAHGVHPNFPDRHEKRHGPVINSGPAIKYNANQRYATNSESASYFKTLCDQAGVGYQEFVNRSDMACGSTIGPITATALGVRTLDVGVPTFGMHSIRELAGTSDAFALHEVLKTFFCDTNVPGIS